MKKLVAWMLVAVMSLGMLTGCSGGTADTKDTEPTEKTEDTDKKEAPAGLSLIHI